MNLTVVVHPTDDHVGSLSTVLFLETKPDITECLHLNLKSYFLVAWRPENEKIIVQDRAVFPLDAENVVKEEKKER